MVSKYTKDAIECAALGVLAIAILIYLARTRILGEWTDGVAIFLIFIAIVAFAISMGSIVNRTR